MALFSFRRGPASTYHGNGNGSGAGGGNGGCLSSPGFLLGLMLFTVLLVCWFFLRSEQCMSTTLEFFEQEEAKGGDAEARVRERERESLLTIADPSEGRGFAFRSERARRVAGRFKSSDPVTTTEQCLDLLRNHKSGEIAKEPFMFVSKKHKYVMCVTPKVASSSWIEYFRYVHMGPEMCARYHSLSPRCTNDTGQAVGAEAGSGSGLLSRYERISEPDYGFYFFDHLSREEQLEVASSPEYFKFTVYRHPWSRLESGYRSKYVGHCNLDPKCMSSKFQLPSMPKYATLAKQSLRSKNRTSTYTQFEAFVDAVTATPYHTNNKHFKPQSFMCGHDCIYYDALVDLKDQDGMDEITRVLGMPYTFSEITGTGYSWTPDLVQLEYSKESVAKAFNYFRVDTYRFNYTFDAALAKAKDYVPPSSL